MNQIEEMMKIAGIEKKICTKDDYDKLCAKYEYCKNAPSCKIYPPFTPEKQLEIIKFF